MLSKKGFIKMLSEGIVVGIVLVVMFMFVRWILPSAFIFDMTIPAVFISGALFHIIFEYTGINQWYAVDYVQNWMDKKVYTGNP
jgi:hypothetical protein